MTDKAEALRIAESRGEDEGTPTLAQTARIGHPAPTPGAIHCFGWVIWSNPSVDRKDDYNFTRSLR
jgi:hypothetical protein